MNLDINKRIESIIKDFGLNKNSFASKLDTSYARIDNIVSGRQSKPSYELIVKIITEFKVNPEWLLLGIGEKDKSSNINPDDLKKCQEENQELKSQIKILKEVITELKK